MRSSPAPLLIAATAAALFQCACAMPPGPLACAQEAAQELNVNARFGRSELAMEHVAPAARDAFAEHHRGWGTQVRVADIELAGMRARDDHAAELLVRVAWYRPEQQELRVTTVRQSWRDQNGWKLVAEQRVEGDVGLLGEPVVYQAPDEARRPAQFPTVRLGETAAP